MTKDPLFLARQAVLYTRLVMRTGASNKAGDVLVSSLTSSPFGLGFSSLACVPLSRVAEDATAKHGDTAALDRIRNMASVARFAGCGNCGEQAAVAFMWLLKKKVAPIEYMQRTTVDHAFVVIGRSAGGPPENWGEACVICDPWDENAYMAAEAKTKLWGGGVIDPVPYARWDG